MTVLNGIKLTEEQVRLYNQMTVAISELREAKNRQIELELKCAANGHAVFQSSFGGAECAICTAELGWWCPSSPNHLCDYNQEDGEYNPDQCRFCGQPEERK